MHPAVLAAFKPFSTKFEGYLPFMYADQKNLITTGMGNLIDPVENALALPWTHGLGGPPATPQEIMTAFNTVKNAGVAGHGGGNQGGLTDLRLNDDGIQQVIAQKLTNNEAILRRRIPKWDSLPADAQLAILSMAWALGPAFNFPKFLASINAMIPDFNEAAFQSWMKDSSRGSPTSLTDDPGNYPPDLNAGLRPRNLANRQLFLNAAQTIATGSPLDQLVWDVQAGVQQVTQAVSQAGQVAVAAATSKTGKVIAGAAILIGAAWATREYVVPAAKKHIASRSASARQTLLPPKTSES